MRPDAPRFVPRVGTANPRSTSASRFLSIACHTSYPDNFMAMDGQNSPKPSHA